MCEAAKSQPKIAIIGAGPAGLCTGIKLKQAGFNNFVIIDKEDGLGGTWYHTRYPGLSCDLKSHIYSFSFELNPLWSRAYAKQPEILAYLQHCATKYGLMEHLRLSTEVMAARWDEPAAQWELDVKGSGLERFDFLVAAPGLFNVAKWPDIPGLQDFKGKSFHAVKWPQDHDLSGETVAIVGSAACAVQVAPAIAPKVDQLLIFQRSPAWVMEKDDPEFTADYVSTLANDPESLQAIRNQNYDEVEAFITFSDPAINTALEESAYRNLAKVRDEELRAKLTPTVPLGCLRPLFSSEYYDIYNRDDVTLVTDGIAHVSDAGIVTVDGRHHNVDTIIMATGYDVGKYIATIPVTGRHGIRLDEVWRDGAIAFMGVMVSGFPNLFMLYGPNTNNGSLLFMFECEADFIVGHIERLTRENIAISDVKQSAMDEFNDWLQAELDNVEVWQANCSNYYRGPTGRIVTQWPKGMTEFKQRMQAAASPAHFDEISRRELLSAPVEG